MTTGDTMPDTAFRALKPAALDELAEDGHARRRDADLARAMSAAAAPRPRHRVRRPVLLVAGVAAAACAAAGAVVVTGGGDTPARPPSAQEGPADARTFLLASATTAAKAPAATGRYWYNRQLTTSEVGGHRRAIVGTGPDRRKVDKKIAYRALIESPGEVWLARDGSRARKTGGPDKLVFPTDRDKALWQQDGSPRLAGSSEKRVWEGPMRRGLGTGEMTAEQIAALPEDPRSLSAVLRDRYQRELKAAENPFKGTFTAYVWGIAHDLLGGPVTPGAKSALFKVLAGQPGIRLAGEATDRLGRPGTAVVAASGPDGGAAATESRLVISATTADLLEFRTTEAGQGTVTTTYEAMGWVGRLGARP
ncbi:CU044_5270 family protein [Actinomadura geliboluensis]|uniref:CU044_5270 family protein n=1 Tax=Actinomadura geliboluensis TaxID=882440 RepID=UPI0037186089